MNAHVHRALLLAISRTFLPAKAEVRSAGHRHWSSATFEGARHHYIVSLSGSGAWAQAERAAATLGQEEFAIAGHIVAEVAVTDRRESAFGTVEIALEALTVEA